MTDISHMQAADRKAICPDARNDGTPGAMRESHVTTYNQGFVDGWDHAIAVLRHFGKDAPEDTALMRMKRRAVAITSDDPPEAI
jgi:hypothetical protein